jgi:hypothetical protein
MESTMNPTPSGVINQQSCTLRRRYRVLQICHGADKQNALKVVPLPPNKGQTDQLI